MAAFFSTIGRLFGGDDKPPYELAEIYTGLREQVLKLTEPHLKQMEKTEKYPVPKPGQTIFYIVTPDGVFTYSAKEDDLGNKRDKLFPLFYAGHELITKMRIADEKRQAEQAGSGQPATRPESKSEGGDKPQPEAEGRSR